MSSSMRTIFDFGTRKSLGHWFPRHMGKGLRQMRELLRKVDCVVEVHDCRIPFSGRNPNLQQAISSKPSLLLLNKKDLAEPSKEELKMIHKYMRNEKVYDYMLTNCSYGEGGKQDTSIAEIIPRCEEIINREYRYDREGDTTLNILVVGIPNVGKSSLINALRRCHLGLGKGTPVGKSPGYTRSLMNRIKVCNNPLMYLYDTPGILEPRISDMNVGMKLAVCNTIENHTVGSAMIADYLLFLLNKKKQFKYLEKYNLRQLTEDIQPLLHNIAVTTKHFQSRKVMTGTGSRSVRIPDYEYAANVMLMDFRSGSLGTFIIDDFKDIVS